MNTRCSFTAHLFSGLPSQAFEYIQYNNGLMTEKDYPYQAYVTKQKDFLHLKTKLKWLS